MLRAAGAGVPQLGGAEMCTEMGARAGERVSVQAGWDEDNDVQVPLSHSGRAAGGAEVGAGERVPMECVDMLMGRL